MKTLKAGESHLRKELRHRISPGYAKTVAGFFKTGPGDYAEGDRFLGVRVPDIRAVAAMDDGLIPVEEFLVSPWHEERLLATLMLVRRFQRGDEKIKKGVFDFYIVNAARFNNWDLVDLSAPQIAGAWLLERPRAVLGRLTRSRNLWERRIAIVATLAFIRAGDLEETFALCKTLLRDPEDLMHKACGWMLREAGKKDVNALEDFLDKHAASMPRTMLRYAIERLPKAQRGNYLARR